MADLYSVISGIQPDQQDIVEAELLAKQILEANFPDMDLREGTGIRDLVLRPSAFLLALCKKGFNYYFDQSTLSNITDESSTEFVDGIMSNLFLSRNLGTQAVINARLYFATNQTTITLFSNTSFSTDGTLLFYPAETTSYIGSTLEYDSYLNEYYLDIDLVAADKGEEYNISSGSLLYFSNFNPYFLHGEVNYLVQSSIDPETNTQFIERASTAISTRNLINKPSIDNVLRQEFNYLNRIVTIGANDLEMHRDQVEVNGFVGEGVLATSMALSDGDTKMLVNLPDHGFILGQKVTLIESSGGTPLVINNVSISTVVDDDFFKITLPITVTPRVFAAPYVHPVEDSIYVHQGGAVDVHCGETLETSRIQLTLDGDGRAPIEGAVLSVIRSPESEGPIPDTVPEVAPFTVEYPGHSSRSDFLISEDGPNVSVQMSSHCLSIGRTVRIVGWPQIASDIKFTVTQLINEDVVVLKSTASSYTVGSGLTPILYYTHPLKDVGFSSRQQLVVDFGSGQANGKASMEIIKFSNMDSVQGFLELSDNRVLCNDILARGFDVCFLNFEVVVYDSAAPLSSEVSEILDTYLSSLSPGSEFILSNAVAKLTDSGIDRIRTPMMVTYSYRTKDMFTPTTGTVTDIFKPLNSTTIFVVGNVVTNSTES